MDLDGTFSKVRASSRMFQKQGCGVTVIDLDGTCAKGSSKFSNVPEAEVWRDRDSFSLSPMAG